MDSADGGSIVAWYDMDISWSAIHDCISNVSVTCKVSAQIFLVAGIYYGNFIVIQLHSLLPWLYVEKHLPTD